MISLNNNPIKDKSFLFGSSFFHCIWLPTEINANGTVVEASLKKTSSISFGISIEKKLTTNAAKKSYERRCFKYFLILFNTESFSQNSSW